MSLTIKYILLIIGIVFYFFYTINYAFKFRKNKIYKGRVRIFHHMMFWLVPFVWTWLINELSKSSKGSHEIDNKVDPISFGGHYNA
jgi:hypothetical protein